PSLVIVKANHAPTGTTIPLEWRDKLLVPVLPQGGIVGAIERHSGERVFVDLLNAATGSGRNVSDSKHAGNYAPKVFAASPNAERYSKRDLEKAMERLFADGHLRMEEYGRRGDPRRRLVHVTNEPSDER